MASTVHAGPAVSPVVELLSRRRSPMPDHLVAPGPGRSEIDRLIEIALRVPDHGRLSPWRLVVIAGDAKQRWVDQLLELCEVRDDMLKTRVSTRKLLNAPLAIVVVSTPIHGHKIPEWEQMLSAGAVCMNLLNGAHALGYGANWLTGWHAYDLQARALLGLDVEQKVAGVILVGSIATEPSERPRATADDVARWL